jgi:hypothetical protein
LPTTAAFRVTFWFETVTRAVCASTTCSSRVVACSRTDRRHIGSTIVFVSDRMTLLHLAGRLLPGEDDRLQLTRAVRADAQHGDPPSWVAGAPPAAAIRGVGGRNFWWIR